MNIYEQVMLVLGKVFLTGFLFFLLGLGFGILDRLTHRRIFGKIGGVNMWIGVGLGYFSVLAMLAVLIFGTWT